MEKGCPAPPQFEPPAPLGQPSHDWPQAAWHACGGAHTHETSMGQGQFFLTVYRSDMDLFENDIGSNYAFLWSKKSEKNSMFDRFGPFSGQNRHCAAFFGGCGRSTVGNRLKTDFPENESKNTGQGTNEGALLSGQARAQSRLTSSEHGTPAAGEADAWEGERHTPLSVGELLLVAVLLDCIPIPSQVGVVLKPTLTELVGGCCDRLLARST